MIFLCYGLLVKDDSTEVRRSREQVPFVPFSSLKFFNLYSVPNARQHGELTYDSAFAKTPPSLPQLSQFFAVCITDINRQVLLVLLTTLGALVPLLLQRPAS
ncbi:unnamed protein product [Mesocestoides corti]|uniref:Uncharacterized protein n=1 Tax=Mesocestoides corti TaxID=53468 RepID=A0A0R3UD97_MESCO|nr:unnamed protein product [Mesocestoides corti]